MAQVKIKMSMQDLLRYQTRLKSSFKPAMQRGLVAGAQRCLPILVRSTDQAPPASKNGQRGANSSGAYRRAWDAESTPNGARVWNKMPYAGIIEKGRRPGQRPPPSKSIQHWLMRRKGMDETEAKHAAFVVAKAIGQRGLKARLVMGRVEAEMTKAVMDEVTFELKRQLRKPGGD